eukprot:m.70114 g.70114  ORF g.70114 m.70114 type:complete len:108 (-) comp13763_c0_seq2:1665-1988(-)
MRTKIQYLPSPFVLSFSPPLSPSSPLLPLPFFPFLPPSFLPASSPLLHSPFPFFSHPFFPASECLSLESRDHSLYLFISLSLQHQVVVREIYELCFSLLISAALASC